MKPAMNSSRYDAPSDVCHLLSPSSLLCLTAGRPLGRPRPVAFLFAGAPRVEAVWALWVTQINRPSVLRTCGRFQHRELCRADIDAFGHLAFQTAEFDLAGHDHGRIRIGRP